MNISPYRVMTDLCRLIFRTLVDLMRARATLEAEICAVARAVSLVRRRAWREDTSPLGEAVAKTYKAKWEVEKTDRPAHRVITKNRFASLDTIDDVIARLIGV